VACRVNLHQTAELSPRTDEVYICLLSELLEIQRRTFVGERTIIGPIGLIAARSP
jgi:hypothetical protein